MVSSQPSWAESAGLDSSNVGRTYRRSVSQTVPIYSSVSSGAVVKCVMGMVQLQVLRDGYVVLCIVPCQVTDEGCKNKIWRAPRSMTTARVVTTILRHGKEGRV